LFDYYGCWDVVGSVVIGLLFVFVVVVLVVEMKLLLFGEVVVFDVVWVIEVVFVGEGVSLIIYMKMLYLGLLVL